MKKSLIIFFLIIFDYLIIFQHNKLIFAAPAVTTIAPTPTEKIDPLALPASGDNPAPPILGSTPCGDTMCLSGEICVRYPFEDDDHCVPEPLDIPVDDVPPSCWKSIGDGMGYSPPGSSDDECFNHFKNTQIDISKYEKTCIYEPIVEYTATRKASGSDKNQPYTMCGKGEAGPNFPPGNKPPGNLGEECDVTMLVYTDVRNATLGSYGPDKKTLEEKSSDFTAQNYLYNGIFGRPNDLSKNDDLLASNRESYRTYWRLLPANNQANLRSFVLNMANEKFIDNIKFDFTNTKGVKSSTTFTELYESLSKQIILFWHYPFIRVGCLVDYPVCPEYAQAQAELDPLAWSLSTSVSKIPAADAVLGNAIDVFNKVATVLGADIKDAYSAFTPLDFNSLRGYIVLKPDEGDDKTYYGTSGNLWNLTMLQDEKNSYRYKGYAPAKSPQFKPALNSVSRENLPYIGAIYQGLLSPKFGMIPSLQPQWIVDRVASKESGLIDYQIGNEAVNSPEAILERQGLLSNLTDNLADMLNNPFQWIKDKVKKIFTKENIKKVGYTEDKIDNTNNEIRDGYVNLQGCPLPVSYHLLSPKTAAGTTQDPTYTKYDDHHQIITIDGDDLMWTFAPKCSSLLEETIICANKNIPSTCHKETTRKTCKNSIDQYEDQGRDMCCQREWKVYGVKHGKALTVLNNPKQTDIKNAVVENDKYSFYKMMLPGDQKRVVDASIDAPIAQNYISINSAGQSATSPNGEGVVMNPAEPINRVNNRAQDSMHLLQNCWTVPKELQNSPRCNLTLTDASASACTGEAFAKLEPNPKKPSSKAQFLWNGINSKLTPDVVSAYTEAEKQTGVPCEVLAGIHFEEGGNNPNQDLQSGAPLNGRSLTSSAIQAAEEIKQKVGGTIDSLDTLIKAMSRYNGGGNTNCQSGSSTNCPATTNGKCGSTVACGQLPASASVSEIKAACTCGANGPEAGSCRAQCAGSFPFQFSYNYCPAKPGYSDPYVTNWWISPEHDNMYLLYMYDCTATAPQIHARPGALTVAIMYYLSHKP